MSNELKDAFEKYNSVKDLIDNHELSEVINLHLNAKDVTVAKNGSSISAGSTFTGLLSDTRRNTGRNEVSGEVELPERSTEWLGNLGYFIVLDQIGKLYKPETLLFPDRKIEETQRKENGNPTELKDMQGCKWSIHYFGSESIYHIDNLNAINAFRNMLAHDFAITGETKSGHTYNFTTTNDPKLGPIWTITDFGEATTHAAFNLRLFGDEVEAIVRTVQHLAKQNKLMLNYVANGNNKFLGDEKGLMLYLFEKYIFSVHVK